MAVAGHAFADDGAVEHVESREQGRGVVVMRHRPAAALLHRQPRLGAVKGLDLALFIDRQHQGLVGRIEVEADNLLDLGDEVRIARELEGFRQMRLDPSSTVSELLVGPSLRKALIWRAFIFGGTDSKRTRDAK